MYQLTFSPLDLSSQSWGKQITIWYKGRLSWHSKHMQNVWKFNNPVAWVECTFKSKYLDLILVPGGNNKPLPAAVHRRGKSTNITSHYKHYHPSYQTLVGLYNHSVGLRISHQQQARRLMVSELASGTTIRRAVAQVTSEYQCRNIQLLKALGIAQ